MMRRTFSQSTPCVFCVMISQSLTLTTVSADLLYHDRSKEVGPFETTAVHKGDLSSSPVCAYFARP